MMAGDDRRATYIEKFMCVFKLKQNYMFGDADYEISKNRQVRLRKPEQMPADENQAIAWKYCNKKLERV